MKKLSMSVVFVAFGFFLLRMALPRVAFAACGAIFIDCPCGDTCGVCNSCNICEGMCECYGVLCGTPEGGLGGVAGGGGSGTVDPGYTSAPVCFGCANRYNDASGVLRCADCWGYLCGQAADNCSPQSFCPTTHLSEGCTPACGQPSICGAACPATDAAPPSDIAFTVPPFAAACRSQIVVSNPVGAAGNFARIGTGDFRGTAEEYYGAPRGGAQAFIPAMTGVLTRIAVAMDQTYSALGGSPLLSAQSVTWSVRADSGGNPGAVLQSGTFQPQPNHVNTIPVAMGITLTAGTRYWVVMTPTRYPGAANVYWTWRRGASGADALPSEPSGDVIDPSYANSAFTFLGNQGTDLDFSISLADTACVTARQNQLPTTVTPGEGGRLTLSWAAAAGASGYDLELFPTGTSCADSAAHCSLQANGAGIVGTSFAFVPSTGNYHFRVRAWSTTCRSVLGSVVYGNWTPWAAFFIQTGISGTTSLDLHATATYNLATGRCVAGGGETSFDVDAAGGQILAVNDDGVFPGIITGAHYDIANTTSTPGTSIGLLLNPEKWNCVCPAGCSYASVTPGFSSTGYDFFVTGNQPPWFQTQNGLLYAGQSFGTALKSSIPLTCVKAMNCTPYLTIRDEGDLADSSGIPMTGGGSIATTFATLSQDQRADSITGMIPAGPLEDYHYFATQLYSLGNNPPSDFSGVKPTEPPMNGQAYVASGDVTLMEPWLLGDGESLVFFVAGDLTIAAAIDVPEGAFIAFIVKGDITVTPSTSHVEGLYYADGMLTIAGGLPDGDRQFIGEGSFVGRQGVQLQRTAQPASLNQTQPMEFFRFRPDLIVNMPLRMMRPQLLWQEVN